MKIQIVSTTIDMNRASAYHHFEMRIPITTSKIIGVECSFRLKSNLDEIPRKDNSQMIPQVEEIGELRLHCANEHQWFYACMLTDLIYKNEKRNHFKDAMTMQKPFVYHGKHEADTCNVKPNTTRIKGFFKDVIGANKNINLIYQITISIHLETI